VILDKDLKKEERQTLHVVLNRGTSQQKAISTLESEEGLPSNTGRVLDVLCFVENHILPLHPLEVLLILGDLVKENVLGRSENDEAITIPIDSW
jgi:hypothetical protein